MQTMDSNQEDDSSRFIAEQSIQVLSLVTSNSEGILRFVVEYSHSVTQGSYERHVQ